MPRIVVIGGGIVGLSTAMMLAKQGHEGREAFAAPGPSRADLLKAVA
jgi:glycine/D-amino acid oxidase-like deaminating enzyme